MDLDSWKSVRDMAAGTLQQFGNLDQMAEGDEYVNSEKWNVRRNETGTTAISPLIDPHHKPTTTTTPVTTAAAAATTLSTSSSSTTITTDAAISTPISTSMDDVNHVRLTPPSSPLTGYDREGLSSFDDAGTDGPREWSLLDIPMDPWQQQQQQQHQDKEDKEDLTEEMTEEEETFHPPSSSADDATAPPVDNNKSKPSPTTTMPMLSVVKALMENGDIDTSIDDLLPPTTDGLPDFDDGYESSQEDEVALDLNWEEKQRLWAQEADSDSDDGGEGEHEFVRLLKKREQGVGGGETTERMEVSVRTDVVEEEEDPLVDVDIENPAPPSPSPTNEGPRKTVWYDVFDNDNAAVMPTQTMSSISSPPPSRQSQQPQRQQPSSPNDNNPKWLNTLTKNPQIISFYQNLSSRARRTTTLPTSSSHISSSTSTTTTATSDPHAPTLVTSSSLLHDEADEWAEWERIRALQNRGWKGVIVQFLVENERFIFIGVTMIVASTVYFYTRRRALY